MMDHVFFCRHCFPVFCLTLQCITLTTEMARDYMMQTFYTSDQSIGPLTGAAIQYTNQMAIFMTTIGLTLSPILPMPLVISITLF